MLDTASFDSTSFESATIEAMTPPLTGDDLLLPFLPLAHYQALGFGQRHGGNPEAIMRSWFQRELLQMRQREQFRQDHGYVLATREAMEVLVEFLTPLGAVMDAGSGSGFLTHYLQSRGVRAIAVDRCDYRQAREHGRGYPIGQVHALDVVGHAPGLITPSFGAVLLSWPPYQTSFALEVAKAMTPGQFLVFEGEFNGCTGNDAFFEHLGDARRWREVEAVTNRLNAVHVRFPGLHDRWQVLERLA